MHKQWNVSITDTLNKEHLPNKDTVCSPNHIELCTNPPVNMDTFLYMTDICIPMVPSIQRFCIIWSYCLDYDHNCGPGNIALDCPWSMDYSGVHPVVCYRLQTGSNNMWYNTSMCNIIHSYSP